MSFSANSIWDHTFSTIWLGQFFPLTHTIFATQHTSILFDRISHLHRFCLQKRLLLKPNHFAVVHYLNDLDLCLTPFGLAVLSTKTQMICPCRFTTWTFLAAFTKFGVHWVCKREVMGLSSYTFSGKFKTYYYSLQSTKVSSTQHKQNVFEVGTIPRPLEITKYTSLNRVKVRHRVKEEKSTGQIFCLLFESPTQRRF